MKDFGFVPDRHRNLIRSVLLSFFFVTMLDHSSVNAASINTIPSGPIQGVLAAVGALVHGGTFVADDVNLAEVTLLVSAQDGTVGRMVVLATSGGVPVGFPLWQGPDIQWPLDLPLRVDGMLELAYQPNIPIVPGETYFVGIDFGLFGSGVPDQYFFVGAAFSDPIPGGQAWGYINGGGWNTLGPAGTDIAVRIVMNEPPVCEIQLSQTSFVTGDPVRIEVFRFANPGAVSQAVEIKVFLTIPGFSPVPIVNRGADGSVVLPTGFDRDFGPVPLFVVTSGTPRGGYQLGCRLLDPVTGQLLVQDLNPFNIQ